MARLYADEDFHYDVVQRLRQSGHDVVTVQEAGRSGGDDPKVLADAIADQRAVLTFNRRHFIVLHSKNPNHFGIIVCSRDRKTAALAKRIDNALAKSSTLAGTLLRINLPPKPKK